jgi:hypothetical protein
VLPDIPELLVAPELPAQLETPVQRETQGHPAVPGHLETQERLEARERPELPATQEQKEAWAQKENRIAVPLSLYLLPNAAKRQFASKAYGLRQPKLEYDFCDCKQFEYPLVIIMNSGLPKNK